jgi:hypothetical protein
MEAIRTKTQYFMCCVFFFFVEKKKNNFYLMPRLKRTLVWQGILKGNGYFL